MTVIGGTKDQTFSSAGGETFIWQVSGERDYPYVTSTSYQMLDPAGKL